MAEDFYDVLDLSRDATQSAVTEAYRDKVKETHPDLSDSDDAGERFKSVVEAEEVLGDEDERARYDRLGHERYVARQDATARATAADESSWKTAGTGSATASGRDGTADAGRTADFEWSNAEREADGDGWWQSHHARQRRRRERQREQYAWMNDAASGMNDGGPTATTQEETNDTPGATGYAVHDWESDRSGGSLSLPAVSQETVFLCGVTLVLYPLLLASTISGVFGVPIRFVLGVLLVSIVGYMLTDPWVGVIVFGVLSVLVPVFVLSVSAVDPLSFQVIVAVLGVWIPFGYAVAIASVVNY